jgi:transposase
MYNTTNKGVLYMRTRGNKVYLEAEQRAELMRMTKNGKHSAMELNHANILLDLDENQEAKYTQKQIASKYRMCPETVAKIARRFVEGGMEYALKRKKRETPAVPSKFTGEVEARIVKLACSAPPKGRKRWTLKLLADETVRLEILDSISDNGIRMLLKKRNLSLT